MKMHRFLGQYDLSNEVVVIDDPAVVHQWFKVLRLAPEERVILCNGEGREAIGEITEIDRLVAIVKIIERRSVAAEPTISVNLCLSLLKKDNFELAVQKAVEVGVSAITPIITERTIKMSIRLSRLEQIIREAAEQSGRGRVPTIVEPILLDQAIKAYGKDALVLDPSGAITIKQATDGKTKVDLFIGPEGGWSQGEIERLKVAGATVANLGAGILRAETAAVIATYLAAR